MLHANGSTAYCHDCFGQLTRKVQTVNGVASTLRYAYTKSGRLAALTYPDGSVADYVRDARGGIAPNGDVWTGGVDGVGENHGDYGAFLPGGRG
ncbi:hypothetical protein [Stenotrophomonas sp. TWI1183]|uniref:hypothetical protein n=1 Tax=Stenotrophomonas sp. TWI1183 TaxID=3136799 RepID=UPI0032081F78